ncbi:prepilin-type N-terminal cleavage/methylation domain-containing protein, partial [bacterium]|nr:prepilin-type N-terminal cleavage/methylation domain-containing protein [bacterium]
MTTRTDKFDRPTERRSGFTLTEMLVAVGLLLIIMTIFAQIFQLAVTAMTRQKGMANNDSRARTAFSVIDADLKRMSFRSMRDGGGLVPLVPGLLYDGNLAAPEQRGYFYYSENDPDNDTDDVLQFTVDASLTGQYA